MQEISFIDNKVGWPVIAKISDSEIVFSGTFEKNRIFKEDLNTFAGYLERGVLWILFVAGLVCLGISIPDAYQNSDWLFLIHSNFYNFFFWLSTYTTTYLWARQNYYTTKKSHLVLENIPHEKNPDIYQYFSKEAKAVWNNALEIAEKNTKKTENVFVNLNDIFLSLCKHPQAETTFLRLSANPKEISDFLERYSKLNAKEVDENIAQLPFLAWQIAEHAQSKNITPLFLLCALTKLLPKKHILNDIFFNLNITEERLETVATWVSYISNLKSTLDIQKKLAKYKTSSEINQGLTSLPTIFLDKFTTDLTLNAKYQQLPIALGRLRDLEEILKLISEGATNLVIKGEEGSGRTTVINNLALKMVSEQVPPALSDKRLVVLHTSSILGSKNKPENVLINCLNEASGAGNIILLIEDLHTLAKTQSSEGFSFLELLINFLENNNLQVLATTTIEAYTEVIAQTQNFSNVFSEYELLKLSNSEILYACCVKASLLEHHNQCFFKLDAIEEAIRLSQLYNKTLAQPQKSIALLVEAASLARHSENKIIGKTQIQKIVSTKTHVPEGSLDEDESEKLLNLEENMAKFVVGQTPALTALAQSLRRARSGLSNQNKPLASFLFLGPTGVGKTEVAKTLAKLYFGEEKLLLRLDMSEFQGSNALAKFLGGQGKNSSPLITHIKNYPFCLILIDEFEKASREIQNLFLQILDDGRLTTQDGETLDFSHALIIATSNAGSQEIQTGIKNKKPLEQLKTELLNSTLNQFFTPELLNRFDEIIVFEPLTYEQVQQIAILQLHYLKHQLYDKGIKMEIAQAVLEDIAKNAFDPSFGARPIRRYIQDHIESYIAKLLLSKDLKRGSQITLDMKDDQLIIL